MAKRAESGMLGGLTVPLTWGVAVPPDDYDHWAPESDDDAEAVPAPVPGLISTESPDNMDEWSEQEDWSEWEVEPEPRFELPRSSNVVPRSPAAG